MTDGFLLDGLRRGFIDRSVAAPGDSVPQLVTNNPARGEKVIACLKQEMASCDEFMFSVAFVNSGGVNALAQSFRELADRGVKGRIIASQYQNFTQPGALRALLKNPNIEVRVITEDVSNMHAKCYIFRHGDGYDVLIGSSNLTNSALCENIEWNLKINSTGSGEVIDDILAEFEREFSLAAVVDEEWIVQYSRIYDEMRAFRAAPCIASAPSGLGRPQPNRMQKEALASLEALRAEGADRALVISATGSGKTYLSAFDARATGMRMLYVVHRLQVLNRSMESFERVMCGAETVARYDPSRNNLDADCTFATVQSISRPEVLAEIPADAFEYILIDEVHHAGAASYRRILDHFRPRFILGMTATPDRTDGFDIYGLFGYNIAYDIRLKEAMELRLICPFHYFGISDLRFDGESEEDFRRFLDDNLESRVDHILSNADYYGFCGDRVKGVVFCSDLKEAETYSAEFNRRGRRTAWVSGRMSDAYVETCIERLECDGCEGALDYIFAADLFNEGVDIPAVNQVVMLRPTESPVVFIQQLGRGLRRHPGKDYVVILDFIGNYGRSYGIPMALSDDRSYSKPEARRVVAAGDLAVPGNSTISFDEISRRRIYESIDRSDFTEAALMKAAYADLRMKLGRIPRLIDFQRSGTMDALNILVRHGTYDAFLSKCEKGYGPALGGEKGRWLERITRIAAAGKRRGEIAALKGILEGAADLPAHLAAEGVRIEGSNLLDVLDGGFHGGGAGERIALIERRDGGFSASPAFLEILSDPRMRDHAEQVAELGEWNWSRLYRDPVPGTSLVLCRGYTYEDACRLLEWPASINAQNIGGYFHHEQTRTFPVFINYVKGEDVAESQRYEDRFVNRSTLVALSKSREGRDSKRMRAVRDSASEGTAIHLFMRKRKDDKGAKEFYYLGPMDFVRFLDDDVPVSVEYRLRFEVRADLYDYFESREASADGSPSAGRGFRRASP